ncbi:MAG TPA: M56 family metallopeptidase [Silvibacterium sp.]|nr:M56 family metallopeptidase [Silvibacterium sp.]
MTTLILESSVRTLVLAAAAWAALRLLRVTNVIAQKIAWTLVLAASIAMPFLIRQHWIKLPPIAIPASWMPHADSTSHAAIPAAIRVQPEQRAAVSDTIDTAIAPAETLLTSATPPASRRWTLAQLRSLIVPGYLVVSGILLLRLLLGLALAFRVWQRAEPASALVEPRADVRFSPDIRTPVTIGLGIVLPASFQDWSRGRLRVVLAHERAHVRQADFYLQLLARLHTAVFWFSPAAWWLQKHLSDLGEAISDYAGIREAQDAPSYAELLLEVAAMPRQPIFAVPMARSSRIERRIDRLLTEQLFRMSFVNGKRRAFVAAAVVPIALAAGASLVAVHAAERLTAAATPLIHVTAQESGTSMAMPESHASAPEVPVAPLPKVKLAAPEMPEPPAQSTSASSEGQAASSVSAVDSDSDAHFPDSDQDSFMIVNGDKSQMFNFHGDYEQMDAIRKRLHGNYILAERAGKYYVIDDPSLMEQSRKLFAPIDELGRQQEALGAQQEKLGEEQSRLGKLQEQAHIETPDMSKEIAELQEAVQKLQELEKSKTVTQGELADIQGRIGGIEGRLGAMQGQIGTQEGEFGRQQGVLGAKQGVLGAQQGKLGAEQGRLAREASRQMQVMIDQAFKEGKAKPVQ